MKEKMKSFAPAAQAKGYSEAGASITKKSLKTFRPSSGSVQEDIDFNNKTLRERSRVLYMSTPIVSSAIKTQRTNVIGQGLRLQPTIDRDVLDMSDEEAEAWQKQTEREFSLWADSKRSCDATGTNDFYGMQQLAFMSWLMSGDVFALVRRAKPSKMNPYSLRLELLEADRVSTPNTQFTSLTTGQTESGHYIFDGVEVDSAGLPAAYHITNHHPFEWGRVDSLKWARIPAIAPRTGLPNVLHVMDSERPGQYRGRPYIAGVMELALQLRKYTEHEVNAAQIESSLQGFVTTQADPTEPPFNQTGDTEYTDEDEDEFALGTGTFVHLKEGESVQTINPARPAGGFTAFVDAIAKQIGADLEIPKDLLLKEFNASYSASRAALLEAWKSFRMRRAWFSSDFCDPVYELFLSEAIAKGRISAPGFFSDPAIRKAYLKCEWIGPSQGQLDPVKEISAEVMAIAEGFTTHKAATQRLNGSNWDDNIAELRIEKSKLDELGGAPDPHQTITGNGTDMDRKEADNDEQNADDNA